MPGIARYRNLCREGLGPRRLVASTFYAAADAR